MRTITRLMLAVLAATLLLMLGTGAAAALRSLRFSGAVISKEGREALVFSSPEAEVRFTCEVLMAKRIFGAVMPKTAGATVGEVFLFKIQGQEAEAERCTGGTAKILGPFESKPVTYVSFLGTLPNISGIVFEFQRVGILITAFAGLVRCLYMGNLREQFIVAGGAARELRFLERPALPLSAQLRGSIACPRQLSVSGTITGVSYTVTLL